jgi:hypothetical protein
MLTLSSHPRHWVVAVEQSLLRLVLVVTGLALVAVGVPFALSIVLLPLGVFAALVGVGVIAWALAGDVSIGSRQVELIPTRPSVLHTPWDCRWRRFGYAGARGKEAARESRWVCIRYTLSPRRVTKADCAHCKEWEPNGNRNGGRQAA